MRGKIIPVTGMFINASAEGWLKGETPAQIRERAGEAYAANQKLSKKAATGVFAKLAEPAATGSKK